MKERNMNVDGNKNQKIRYAILNIFLLPSATKRSVPLGSVADRQEPMHVPYYISSSHTASIHLPHVLALRQQDVCTRQT